MEQLGSNINVCRFCTEPVVDGHKVCKKHLAMCREHAAKARAARDLNKSMFRIGNDLCFLSKGRK